MCSIQLKEKGIEAAVARNPANSINGDKILIEAGKATLSVVNIVPIKSPNDPPAILDRTIINTA